MALVAIPTQDHDIFRLLKPATRVRLVVDVQTMGGGAQGALKARPLERQSLDALPVCGAQ
jgi:hypothetical protein